MSNYKNLINGFKQFYKENYCKNKSLFKKLQEKQTPQTLFISCSDSRVDPSTITKSKLGKIFVIRNIANLVPNNKSSKRNDSTIASLEFAVKILKVKNIIVLGHSGCAGVQSIISKKKIKDSPYVNQWITIGSKIQESLKEKNRISKEKIIFAEKENIKHSLNNIMTFSWIKNRSKKNELSIYGWYFSIEDCNIHQYNKEKDCFIKIKI